jgi:hypothetical protein
MGLLDKVKGAAGQVAEQAKQATAVGKERLDEVRTQRRVDDLYEDIGRLVVAAKRDAKPDDFDTRLKSLIVEIDDLEAQLQAAATAPPAPPAPAPAETPTSADADRAAS